MALKIRLHIDDKEIRSIVKDSVSAEEQRAFAIIVGDRQNLGKVFNASNEKMRRGDKDLTRDLREVLTERRIKGEYRIEQNMRSVRSLSERDVWFCTQTGTGGYGDVLERDPESVVKDVKHNIISPCATKSIYKVVYHEGSLQVNLKTTETLRQKERRLRLKRGKPFAMFKSEWTMKKPDPKILDSYGQWPSGRAKATTWKRC